MANGVRTRTRVRGVTAHSASPLPHRAAACDISIPLAAHAPLSDVGHHAGIRGAPTGSVEACIIAPRSPHRHYAFGAVHRENSSMLNEQDEAPTARLTSSAHAFAPAALGQYRERGIPSPWGPQGSNRPCGSKCEHRNRRVTRAFCVSVAHCQPYPVWLTPHMAEAP